MQKTKATKSVRLFPETHAEIEQEAKKTGLERAEIVRRAVYAYTVVKHFQSQWQRPRLEVRA